MSRDNRARSIMAACALVASAWLILGVDWSAAAPGNDRSMTGEALPGLEHFDRIMHETMREHRLPGASLTVSVKGKIVLARGYGIADLTNHEAVHPRTLFNIASCTKTFTGVAACKLFEDGRLDLDAKVFRLLPHLLPEHGRVDPRAHQITVRQLLHHSAGFIKEKVGGDGVLSIAALVRERMAQPLDYDPGTRSNYSNLSFLLLRLVIHHVSGDPYERYVEQNILRPIGVTDMRLDIERGYLPNEARRYHAGTHKLIEGGRGKMQGGGCWLSSSVDMVRFLSALDGSSGKRLLSEKALREMLAAPPQPYEGRKNRTHFGLGWDVVRQTPDGVIYNKDGGVPGIQTFMQHLPGDVDWALCFNANGNLENKETGPEETQQPNARAAIMKAIAEQKQWPDGDLRGRLGQSR